MDQNELNAVFSKYGFEEISGIWCGVWKGYALSLRKLMGTSFYADVAVRVDKVAPIRKAVKKTVKETCRKTCALVNLMQKVAIFNVSFAKADSLDARFTEVMDCIAAALTQSGTLPANTCALSGAANPDSLCLVQVGNLLCFQPVSGAAARNQSSETQARVEENENNGSLLGGILGAVLGAAVGIAVNVLIIVFTERIFAVAFALIPVAAMFGYKLLKGKTSKLALAVVIALSVISVPVMCVFSAAGQIAKEYSMKLGDALSVTMELLGQDADFTKAVFSDLPMMILFMALGVFIAWRYLGASLNSTQLKASSAQMASLRPNPNYTGGSFQL